MRVVAVIMAGGKGERFWPLSRLAMPKQFLRLIGDRSLLQQTVDRLEGIVQPESVFVVTSSEYAETVRTHLPDLPPENVLREPVGRNTAPCIGLASSYLARRGYEPDTVMLVLPADHCVGDVGRYRDALLAAVQVAAERRMALVTLGLQPDRPETGYGYIHCGRLEGNVGGIPFRRVHRFVEKPTLERAREFLADGEYLWNSGMFAWQLSTIQGQMASALPDMQRGLSEIEAAIGTPDEVQVIQEVYPRLPSISVDYGVMEKADEILVVSSEFGWDDVGSWPALERLLPQDKSGIAYLGAVAAIDSHDCILHAPDGKVVAILGVSDLVIVDTPDALLVCDKRRSQDVRLLTQRLRELGRTEYL